MAKEAAVCIELDYCVGCSQCQLACQTYYNLPVTETYMRMIIQKPDVVDGRHEMFMCPYPYRLDKCKYCLEQEGEAVCQPGCISRALHVGTVEEMEEFARTQAKGRTALFR